MMDHIGRRIDREKESERNRLLALLKRLEMIALHGQELRIAQICRITGS